jgi:hypothetical protein
LNMEKANIELRTFNIEVAKGRKGSDGRGI